MIRTFISPAFKGTIIVPYFKENPILQKPTGGIIGESLNTDNIKVIRNYGDNFTNIVTKDKNSYLVPKAIASKKDITEAYIAAKDSDIYIEAAPDK